MDNVPVKDSETTQYIGNNMIKVCEREKLSVEEAFYFVIFGLLMMIVYVFGINV